MKFIVAVFGWLAFVHCIAAKKSGADRRKCIGDMEEIINESQLGPIDCGKLRRLGDCYVKFDDRCMAVEKRNKFRDKVFKILGNFREVCISQKNDTDFDDNETAEEISEERECADDMEKVMNEIRTWKHDCENLGKFMYCFLKLDPNSMTLREKRRQVKNMHAVLKVYTISCSPRPNIRLYFDDSEITDEQTTKGRNCEDDMKEAIDEIRLGKNNCEKLEKFMHCFLQIDPSYMTHREKRRQVKNMHKVLKAYKRNCSSGPNHEDNFEDSEVTDERDTAECVANRQKIMLFYGQCREQTVLETNDGSLITPKNNSDQTCQKVLSLIRCMTAEIAYDCGEHAGGTFYIEMVLTLKTGYPKLAESPECADAISEVIDYIRNLRSIKRRSVRSVPCENLMP